MAIFHLPASTEGLARTRTEAEVYKTSTALVNADHFGTPTGGTEDAWIPRGSIREVVVAGYSSHASAANGVIIEQSMDGTNECYTVVCADEDGNTTVGASKFVGQIVEITAPYWRFKWTNGSTTQTAFNCVVSVRA